MSAKSVILPEMRTIEPISGDASEITG